MLLSLTEFIGRFHPVFVHLPIGILLMALLLQWLSRKEQYALSHRIMVVIWSIGIFSAIISCITGYLLSLKGEYDTNTVNLHMWMGIAVAGISILIGTKIYYRRFDIVYKIASLSLLVLIGGTGHFGGSLTHGDDYLFAAMDDEDENQSSIQIKPIANVQEANIYADVVQPIFQTRCYNCHGQQKQKGKLRMDSPEFLIKGGKNGEVMTPGSPEESELIKRLLLPTEDKKHMPPKGKPQLTKDQITLLHWWMEEGASFNKKIKELPQNDKIKPVLASLQNSPEGEVKTALMVPETPVKAADQKAVDSLRKAGVVVVPVAQNSNYLSVNFVTAANISDKEMRLLLPLKQQLLWLKLSNATIGDEVIQYINECTKLSVLQLNHTGITDKGLSQLSTLKELRSLNLVGTNVSAKGLLALKDLLQLKTVYLFQTQVSGKDLQQLKRAFPKTVLDTGGYYVPTLASDTTVFVKEN